MFSEEERERERGYKVVMGRLLLLLLFVGFASPSAEVSLNQNPQQINENLRICYSWTECDHQAQSLARRVLNSKHLINPDSNLN